MKVIEKITSICKLSISILIIILLIQLVYDYSDGMIEIDIDLSHKGYIRDSSVMTSEEVTKKLNSLRYINKK